MATINPFRALRPDPGLASNICELPYDVMSSSEARTAAGGNPLSFLHVSKPEIDLPEGTDLYSPEVYAKGAENLEKLIKTSALRQDAEPRLYLYRQIMGNHSQIGLVAVASCEEYLSGIIKKHELTRPDKEDDRVRHIEVLNSQTGPVFLTYRAVKKLDTHFATIAERTPTVDFREASDGVRHSSWVIESEESIHEIMKEFSNIPFLYIADGHHRSAAAARVFQSRQGKGESRSFLAVIFPHNQMQILPYNRVLKDLNGHPPAALLEKMDGIFIVKRETSPEPHIAKHELALFISRAAGTYTLNFRPRFTATTDPVEKLDVTLLQKYAYLIFYLWDCRPLGQASALILWEGFEEPWRTRATCKSQGIRLLHSPCIRPASRI